MELKDTIEGMLSDDYKERFKAEYKQLCIRLDKLNSIIEQYHNKTLKFNLSCPIALLKRQAAIMTKLRNILEARADIEGINLD